MAVLKLKYKRDGKVVDSPADGTIYLHSSGVASTERIRGNKHLAAKYLSRGQLYQKIDIDGNHLEFKTHDIEGTVIDEFVIEK